MKAQFFILILILFLSQLNLFADGIQPDGEGTENNPYLVASLDNLLWISTNQDCWASHFSQTADIDASETQAWNDSLGFSPIGSIALPFSGVYDGNDYTISVLSIHRTGSPYIGMFGVCTSDAVLTNIVIEQATVEGSGYVGILCGSNEGIVTACMCSGICDSNDDHIGGMVGMNSGGEIINCEMTGRIRCAFFSFHVGGLVGSNTDNGVIRYCSTNVEVTSPNAVGGLVGFNDTGGLIEGCVTRGSIDEGYPAGGLVGENRTIIRNCISYTSVNSTYNWAGGLVGCNYENAAIEKCQSFGNVHSTGVCVGGLIGMNASCSVISECSSSGTVDGNVWVGGLIGYTDADIINCYSRGQVSGETYVGGLVGTIDTLCTVSNCYSTGAVTGDSLVGGLVGQSLTGTVQNSYWNTEASGQDTSAGGEGRTTEQMTTPPYAMTYLDWDFEDVWADDDLNVNGGFPVLVNTPVSNGEETSSAPSPISLKVFPNPFNPSTSVSFSLAQPSQVAIDVFNIRGQKVRRVVNQSSKRVIIN